jgi:uncharacterized membrane protein
MEKYTYEVNEKTQIIQRSDGAAIPMDEANSDYQAYLNKDKPQVEHLTEIPTE